MSAFTIVLMAYKGKVALELIKLSCFLQSYYHMAVHLIVCVFCVVNVKEMHVIMCDCVCVWWLESHIFYQLN
jgi:hypothetical protein